MPKVSKVGDEHFELVYPLLKKFDSTHSKEVWKNIFVQPFNNGEDNCGYSLFEGERIVGYLGYIYSSKTIDNKVVKFCNLTTWIVEEEYRNSSLLLIYPILKMKEYCITNYIPALNVYNVSKKLGFKNLDTHENIILPVVNPFKYLMFKGSLLTDLDEITTLLIENQEGYLLKIVKDHKKYSCHFILIQSKNDYCLVVFTKTKRKKISFASIQFISDHELFFKSLDRFKLMLLWRYKLISLIIEDRHMKTSGLLLSFKKKYRYPQIYRGTSIHKSKIDNLYSELIMLN